MSNKFKGINIRNHTCYFFFFFFFFFDDIINILNFDPNNVKTDEKSSKNILIYYIGYATIKDSKYAKINNANPLYLILSKVKIIKISYRRYFLLMKSKK